MTVHLDSSFNRRQGEPTRSENGAERLERVLRLVDSMVELPDAVTAGPAPCTLLAAELADAGISLVARHPQGGGAVDLVLADYPPGIGLGDLRGDETMSAPINLTGTVVNRSVSSTSHPASRGKTGTASPSTVRCAMNCSTARSSTPWRKPRS